MKVEPKIYKCDACGAPVQYDPSAKSLKCGFCGTQTMIGNEKDVISKYDLDSALEDSEKNAPKSIDKETTCSQCGSGFSLELHASSTLCPHCDTSIIVDFSNHIRPESILPFSITHKKAKEIFADWIGSLWFAPSELKALVDTDKSMTGHYLPYWLYDADTSTYYNGSRGDIYYVTVEKRTIVDGKEQVVEEQEERIRWTPVSGRIKRDFNDVAIEATHKLPHNILESLKPWDTTQSQAFNDKYLSGFESQEYDITLKDGYDNAQSYMSDIIKNDIENDIGGDKQEIDSMNIDYQNKKFKNSFLPLWTTSFRYNSKDYIYAINGDSGKITGQRPYSYTKIAILVTSIIVIGATIAYFYR